MSAALRLVPWIAATYDHAQIRQWQISADRLSADMTTGIDYPTPAHVSHICEMLLCAVTDADVAELKSELEDEERRAVEAEDEREEAREERDEARKERDVLQDQLDATEGRLTELDTTRAALLVAETEAATMRAQLVRAGDALRLIADAIREEHPIAVPKKTRAKKVGPT